MDPLGLDAANAIQAEVRAVKRRRTILRVLVIGVLVDPFILLKPIIGNRSFEELEADAMKWSLDQMKAEEDRKFMAALEGF